MNPIDTVRKNLAALAEEGARITEKRLYELSELSRVVYEKIKDDLGGEENESLFHRGNTDALLFDALDGEEIPTEYLPLLGKMQALSASLEIASFSLFLAEEIRSHDALFSPWRESHTPNARIAYVPTGKAEKAYFALADARKDASVHYATSASDALSALLSHQADFVMLPYISASGQTLSGTERLWMENDLFLSALVTVANGEEKLVYALLSSFLSPYAETDGMSLCLEVIADTYAHLGRIFSVLPVLGYRQTSVFAEWEEYGRIRARITLDGDGDDVALWLYLSFDSAGMTPLGRYPTLEIQER